MMTISDCDMGKELIMTDKGFFLGRQLKNGNLSKDSRRITEDEIVKMFAYFFSAYCAKNKTDKLLIGDGDYGIVAMEVNKTDTAATPQG